MNTSLTAYTHLESLLLFQSLATYGVAPHSFSRISELLKQNPFIHSDKRFESGRLSPDALRNFYHSLLKDEASSEGQDGAPELEGQNGQVRNTRKRKAPSPSLPTVQEATQHASLIPKLVTKLYARYRAAVTAQIREEEQKYEKLQRDIQDIEQGEWDSHLEKFNGTSPSAAHTRKSPRVPHQLSPSPQPQHDGVGRGTPGKVPIPDGPISSASESQNAAVSQNGQDQTERDPKHVPGASLRKKQPAVDLRATPSTPQSAPSPVPPATLTPQAIPSRSTLTQTQLENTGHNGSPAHTHRSPYPPPGAPPQVQLSQPPPAAGSPHMLNQAIAPHPQATPMISTPGTPYLPQSMQSYGPNGVAQYGPPSQQSSTPQRVPYPQGSHSPAVQLPQHQRNAYPPAPTQHPFPSSSHHHPPAQPPPQSGFMLPPFQVSPQDPSRVQHQPSPSHYAQVSTPVSNRQGPPLVASGPPTAASARAGVPSIFSSAAHQGRASFSTPLGVRTPQSGTGTPTSAKTFWKRRVSNIATPPAPRPKVDPIDDLDPAPPKGSPQKTKTARKSKGKGRAKETEPEPEPVPEADTVEEPAQETEGRQGRSRGRRRAATRRGRLGSVASSQAGGSVRERSPSIVSHTETVTADNESQAGHRVKSERGTSFEMMEEEGAATPSQPVTRRRGRNAQIGKRKREASPAVSEEQHPMLEMPRTVIAPRTFSKMSNPVMNDISSHKHASIFSSAVKPKDAEGYYDIIKRPTDLKTIQKAINAGNKIVANAASETPGGSPGATGGFVELPLTVDVVPPKAIVNAGQLEKELTRIFANAVMFNPGDEGVVEDAKEMAEYVQEQISRWRNIEHSGHRLEIEETPPVAGASQDEEAPATSKRRRL